MKLELRNVHIERRLSEETTCYTASLYKDGKRVATISNDGRGGADRLRWTDLIHSTEIWREVKAAMLASGELDVTKDGWQRQVDIGMEQLWTALLMRAEDKKLCQGGRRTLYRRADMKPGDWLGVNVALDAPTRLILTTQRGAIEFLNDRIGPVEIGAVLAERKAMVDAVNTEAVEAFSAGAR